MYQISNRQYDEVIEFLCAFASTEREDMTLREYNRLRRARLLVKALRRKTPIINN